VSKSQQIAARHSLGRSIEAVRLFFKEFRLKMRAAKRLGAFARAIEQGMSSEQARVYSDNLYPPTAEDLEYETQLRRKNDPVWGRADTLVQSAEINAASAFMPLRRRFSLLKTVEESQWDFFATVAGVFIASTRLSNLRLGEGREQELMDTVGARLNQWDAKNGIRAFEDCKSFFDRNFVALTNAGHESQFVAADAVGLWIVWNILERAPDTNDERRLVRVIGAMIVHAFFDWWDEG
jgi:hypothetical protein